MESEFSTVFNEQTIQSIVNFIHEHGLVDKYLDVSEDPNKLFDFGMEYGLIEIIVYCYCIKKCSVDIHGIIQKYTGKVDSHNDNNDNCILVDSSSNTGLGGLKGQVVWDRFSYRRQACLNYLHRMIKFSKCSKHGQKFMYTIVDKYIDQYRLLNL